MTIDEENRVREIRDMAEVCLRDRQHMTPASQHVIAEIWRIAGELLPPADLAATPVRPGGVRGNRTGRI